MDQVIDRVAVVYVHRPDRRRWRACARRAIAKPALLTTHVAVGLVVVYRERLQRAPGTSLGDVAGPDDRSF